MTKPKVLITAATGKTGFQAALQLLEAGFPVRAFVRRTDQRSEALRRQGAEILIGSLENIGEVRQALEGIQRAYFCAPLLDGCLRKSALFALLARECNLELVVAMSQWLADPTHLSVHTRETWFADQVFSQLSGIDTVIVNPGWFADNYMAAMEPIAQLGMMPMPLGEGLNAPPSNEDIARVVVGALTNPAPHVGKTYRPTGPELLSPEDIAATFAKVFGWPVQYRNVPLSMFSKVAKALGYPDFVIAQLHWYFQEYQKNAFGQGAPTRAVLDVTGRPPEDFETIVRRYVATSPYAKRSIGSRLRAVMSLGRILLTPSPDLEALARARDFASSRPATLAVDSALWRETHWVNDY
ncbi:MAG: NmrA family NAD(P)-binding protein [Pseudomonadota bacterium]